MDNLKSLMDKKEYELVIKLTNSSKDCTSLFYRISSFLALNKAEEGLKVINENKQILAKDLSLLMKIHIEILCLLNRFDEARKEMNYYSALPYQNQSVEELLNYLPSFINEEEKRLHSFKYVSNEQIIEKLTSKNNNDVLIALDLLKERDVLYFLNELKDIMLNYKDQLIRSYALLLLVKKEINREVRFNSDGHVVVVNPQKLKPPFVDQDFNNLIKKIQTSFKDTTLIETSISLLSTYILYYYPEEVKKEDEEALLLALYKISGDYISNPVDNIEELAKDKNLNIDIVNEYITKINKALIPAI